MRKGLTVLVEEDELARARADDEAHTPAPVRAARQRELGSGEVPEALGPSREQDGARAARVFSRRRRGVII
ncbi:MAG TPA: hypothetical protein PKE00_10060, partial [Planctomycetota bacterium]|nr:hypothetical protein [Planctomycetota bacterium]